MKRTPFLILTALLCSFMSACDSSPASSITSVSKYNTSTCSFDKDLYEIRIGEMMDLPTPTITPAEYQDKWYPSNSSNGSVLALRNEDGTMKALGMSQGEAAINFQCKLHNEDGSVPKAQASFKVIDPVSESSSVSALLSSTSDKAGSLYSVNAILEGADSNNLYGSAYLIDPISKEQIQIAHSSEYDLFRYDTTAKSVSFNYNDSRCVSSPNYVSGDLVTVYAQLQFDGDKPYLDGYFQKKETNDVEPVITIKDGDNITLSKTTGLKWGETITATVVPEDDRVIKALVIDRGYTIDNGAGVSATVFSFTLTSSNYLSVTYAEVGTTPIVNIYFTWFFKDDFSSPFTSTSLDEEVKSHLSDEEKDYYGSVSSVSLCYPAAKGIWMYSGRDDESSFSISLSTNIAKRVTVSAYRHQPSDTSSLHINGSSYVPESDSVPTMFEFTHDGLPITTVTLSLSVRCSMYIHSVTFYK